jgi:hypothetical protein
MIKEMPGSVASWTSCIIQVNFPPDGRVMAQAVGRRLPPPTAEARFRFQISPREICCGQSGSETGLFLRSSVFPCQYNSTSALYSSSSTSRPYMKEKWPEQDSS